MILTGSGARRLARLALLLIFVLPLAGCASSAGGRVLHIWYSTDDPVERSWAPQLARAFEASHPGVHVQLSVYSFEDLNTKLQLALSAGDPPDLAYVTPRGPGIPAYIGAHRLRDLSGAARGGHWAAKLRPGLLAQYNEPFSFLGARPGEVVAVPTALAAVGILYNRALLARLHLTVPDSPAAFARDLARAKASGYTPIELGNGDGWLGDDWYLTLVNALAPPADLAREQRLARNFSFRRAPFVRAAQILQRWAQRAYFTTNFGGLDAQEGLHLFFGGHTLFTLVSSSQNPQIVREEARSHLPIGVFAFPRAGGGRVMPVSGYLGWVVPAAARHPADAEAFINSLLSRQVGRFLLGRGVLPAMRVGGAPGGAALRPSLSSVWQAEYLNALETATPGVYLDAAPVPNINATMEANVQLLLQGYEPPSFLVHSLQDVYDTRGRKGSTARIDGEF